MRCPPRCGLGALWIVLVATTSLDGCKNINIGPPQGDACTVDEDCALGQRCVDATCAEVAPDGGTPQTDASAAADAMGPPNADAGGDAGACTAMCGGACTDTTQDGANCGACGHDCLGGACIDGVCQPMVLATQQAGPIDLALDGEWVYFTNHGTAANGFTDGSVAKVKKDGTGLVTLVGPPNAPLAGPLGITVDSAFVYFTTQGDTTRSATGAVSRVPLAGGNLEVFAQNQAQPSKVVVNASNVFWVNQGTPPDMVDGSLMRCPKTGCGGSPTAIMMRMDHAFGLTQDTSAFYVASRGNTAAQVPGAIWECPFPCSTNVERIATQGSVQNGAMNVVTDGTELYWTDMLGGSSGSIVRMANGSGSPSALVSGEDGPRAIAVDDGFLYFADYATGASIRRVPVGGGMPTAVATKQSAPAAIVTDAKAIYWVDFADDTVRKVAK